MAKLLEMYASGHYRMSKLAKWMNDQNFRPQNFKTLMDPHGNLVSGPRQFMLYSVRGILHNPFYAGHLAHGKELYQGNQDPLVSPSATYITLIQGTISSPGFTRFTRKESRGSRNRRFIRWSFSNLLDEATLFIGCAIVPSSPLVKRQHQQRFR